jgi:hypothetical protein
MALVREKLIDTRLDTFYPLLHGLLRAKTSTPEAQQAETARTKEMRPWLVDHMPYLLKVVDDGERELLQKVYGHYRDFKLGPTRQTLEDMIRRDVEFPDALINYLTVYDQHVPSLNLPEECMVRRTTAREKRRAIGRSAQMYSAFGWRAVSPGHDELRCVLFLINGTVMKDHFREQVASTPLGTVRSS